MVEWSDGYVTHINYTSGFYEGLSPHAQSFALLYRGFAPPEMAEGFTYCELGCGHGFTTALLAAASPHGANEIFSAGRRDQWRIDRQGPCRLVRDHHSTSPSVMRS